MSKGELAYIDWIKRRTRENERVAVGVGDDMAAVRVDGQMVLVGTDTVLDGVHVERGVHTPQQIGRKAMACSLSDVAAMAGVPRAATVAVTLPDDADMAFAEGIHSGAAELADQFACPIVGGDVTSWGGRLAVTVTVLAEPGPAGIVGRRGAKGGDAVVVTGSFGGSLGGKHIEFVPRVAEALRLAEEVELHAMIDVTDGLVLDLWRLCQESRLGAIVNAAKVPISDAARTASGADGQSPLEHALYDGEDFELLFTIGVGDMGRLPKEIACTVIGGITKAAGVLQLRSPQGELTDLEPRGWEHFR